MSQKSGATDKQASQGTQGRAYAHSGEYEELLVATKSGTEIAIRMKEFRIPFQVCEADIRELDYDLREKEFKEIIELVLGKVVLLIGDKKRLSGVAWINRYPGSSKPEKFQNFANEFFDVALPNVSSIIFAKTGNGWKVAGYKLIENNEAIYEKLAGRLKYAFEESQGYIHRKKE